MHAVMQLSDPCSSKCPQPFSKGVLPYLRVELCGVDTARLCGDLGDCDVCLPFQYFHHVHCVVYEKHYAGSKVGEQVERTLEFGPSLDTKVLLLRIGCSVRNIVR